MEDVAQSVGLSRMTVSRALREEQLKQSMLKRQPEVIVLPYGSHTRPIIFTLFAPCQIIRGMTAGAVKG